MHIYPYVCKELGNTQNFIYMIFLHLTLGKKYLWKPDIVKDLWAMVTRSILAFPYTI